MKFSVLLTALVGCALYDSSDAKASNLGSLILAGIMVQAAIRGV